MASPNSQSWITRHQDHVGLELLEVGSRRYKQHAFLDLRGWLRGARPQARLTGCDIAAGDNVDVVVDLTAPFAQVSAAFGGRRFDTVFCVSVLEHIPDVPAAARNLQQLLAPGGALFVSVPFVFRYHGYPGDLWRFTPEAVVHIFPGIDFRQLRHCTITTQEEGDSMSLAGSRAAKINRFLFRPRAREERLERKRAKAAGIDVAAYSLAPAMINMLGFRT